MKLLAWLQQFLGDLRFGARNLAKSAAFSAVALGSLALGIGASTAMYSVIYAVILDPFPYKDVDHLMSVELSSVDQRRGGSYYTVDQFVEIAERNSIFSGTIASTWDNVTWTGAGDPQRVRGNHCTFNTFDVMGVPPLLGRVTTPADALEGAEPVVVLGYKFWQRQFAGGTTVLGRRMELNGVVRTVIGVMPRRFMWRGADVYLPITYRRGQTPEGVQAVHLLGRLKPGVTAAQAEADLRPIMAELQLRKPDDFPKKWRVGLVSFKETFPSGIREALWILFGAVGLLFLIACVNVSNLLLSRAAYRQREMAIRAALGAGRSRLIRQLLAESLVLALGGAALGVAFAHYGLRAIIAIVPPNTIPDESLIALNTPVLSFTLGVAVIAAVLFGLFPALHLSGRDIVTPLKEAGPNASGSPRQRVLRNLLVAGEVALSLVLLVGAALMLRTLFAMTGANVAVPAERILTLRVPFSEERYPGANRRIAFLQEVKRRIESVPGVRAASVSNGLHPLGAGAAVVQIPGNAQQDNRRVALFQTSESYLNTMGVPLVEGRFFTEQEVTASLHSAAVNQAFARRYFAGRPALGQTVRIPSLLRMASAPRANSASPALTDDSFQVVGVVKDTMNRVMTNETIPEVYIPYTLLGRSSMILVLSHGRPETVQKAVCAQVYAVDSAQPVMSVATAASLLDDWVYAEPRFNLLLFGLFAALGLLLALFGIYGVISNSVAQRTREIGIRMALGASFGQVMTMVLGMGARVVAVGIAVGLAASFVSVRILAGLVRNVSAFDPYSFGAVSLLLFLAGLFASFWPARRAARVDPVTALRLDR